MRRNAIIALLAGAAALGIISWGLALPPLHEDIATGGLDPDGDHYLTGGTPGVADPMPAVYCNEGHVDVNRNGAVTLFDELQIAAEFGLEPPGNPLADPNHNDQGDVLDIIEGFYEVGSPGAECSSAVADTMMPAGLGATSGPSLGMSVVFTPPQPPAAPAWGTIVVTVSTSGVVPDPYSGYWINLRFNELSVAGVVGSFTDLTPFTGPVCGGSALDNTDDIPAVDDGSFKGGCGTFGATTAVAGPLATLTFTRIGAAPPNFCLGSFGAPDMGLALRGTYTFAPDRGAQAQTNTGSSVDSDGDLIGDCLDNCPTVMNAGQANNDAFGGPFGATPPWIADATAGAPEGASIGGDVCDVNDDNNGCTDVAEPLLVPPRDPLNPWDFADMWVPSLPAAGVRGGAIGIADAIAVLPWIGTVNGGAPNGSVPPRDYDDDANANGVEDGAEYDRSPTGTVGLSGPPSGAVTLADALVVIAQGGDFC